MIGRLINNRYGTAVLGLVLVVIGFNVDGGKVMCGGVEMKAGDQCETTRKGNSVTRTFEEEQRWEVLSRYGAIGGGALMFIIGTGLIVKRHVLDPKHREPAVAAAGGEPPLQQPAQPYPQQQTQGYAPQQAQGYPQHPAQPYAPQQAQGYPQQPAQPYPPQQ